MSAHRRVDVTELAQFGEVALGDEIEMRDERLHGRIETIAFEQLNGDTFGEIACADAGRFERLDERQHLFDSFDRRAEAAAISAIASIR